MGKVVLSSISVGWFGRIGWRGVMRTHAVVQGNKLCGNKTGRDMEFFRSGHWPHLTPECDKCKAKLEVLESHL